MYNFQKDDETIATNETPMSSDKYIPKSKRRTTSHPATEANTATAQGLNYKGPHWLISDKWAVPCDKIDSIYVFELERPRVYAHGTSTPNAKSEDPYEKPFYVFIRTTSGCKYEYPCHYATQKEATSCVCRLVKELAHPIGKYTRIVTGENVVVDD